LSQVTQAVPLLETVDDVQDALGTQRYVADSSLATAIYLSLKLPKPLLLEGEAGVGKTEVAKVLATLLQTDLIRLQCYEGLDISHAVYEWNYPRQMLAIRAAEASHESREAAMEQIFSEDYLIKRPLLQAIEHRGKAPVLLIDEIDRADEEFEAFLLELLSDFQVTVPELGTMKAEHPPIVIVTSNRTRELSEALKRRCLHLQIPYPTGEMELEIVRLKAPGISEALSEELVRTIQDLRTLDLRKAPSIGETLDWAQSLVVLGAPNLSKDLVESTISVIAKYDRDAQKMLDHLGVNARERRDLGQKEPTGENPSEGMYEMHRSVHKHAH